MEPAFLEECPVTMPYTVVFAWPICITVKVALILDGDASQPVAM
jgi:hypothetical protein